MDEKNNIAVLYLFMIFLGIFIVSSYFIIIKHSIECYIIIILLSDSILLIFYDFLSKNNYKLFNKTLDFKLFFLIWAVFILIFSLILFPKNQLNKYF